MLVLAMLLQVGCSAFPHQLSLTNPTAQQAWQALQQQHKARKQLQAQLQVRAVGLASMIAGTQHMDIVVQSPSRLLLFWHSFFGQPALAASYNGQEVCVFEPSQHPAISCYKAAADDSSWLQQLIALHISPQHIAAALLGVVPNLHSSKRLSFALDKSGQRHRTVLLHPNGNQSVLYAHVSTGALIRYELHNPKGKMQYRLDYIIDTQTQHKHPTHTRIRLNTYLRKQRVQLMLHIKKAQWNTTPLPQQAFDLRQTAPTNSP